MTKANKHVKIVNTIRAINTGVVEFETDEKNLVFLARKSKSHPNKPIWKICADGIYVLDVYAHSYGLTIAGN